MQGETRDEEPEQAILQPADKRAEAAPTASADDTTLPPSFSIAVLAFNNMSDDRELDWVADGLSEDIITKLGKASILNVAARNSSFVWKGTSPDIREVGRELNVRFVVEGSIRVVGQTLRLNAQLIDTLTGAHIWAEIYDLPRDNPDAALHGVEDVVAGELLAVLRDVEIDRLLKLDDAALTVDDIVALCWGKAVVTSTAEGTQDAIDILRRGLASHAGAAELHAELAHYCCTMGRNFDKENRDDLLQECRAHLEQAIRLEPLGEMSLFRACTVRYLLGEYEESLTAGRLFADLYPDSHAPVHCMPMRVLGHYEETLSVVDPWLATSSKRHIDRRWVLEFKGTALLGLGEFEAAEKVLREAGGEPFRPSAQLPTVVALAHQGKLDEAAKAWSVYQASPGALSPDRLEQSISRNSTDPAWIDMYLEGLRLAGCEFTAKELDFNI